MSDEDDKKKSPEFSTQLPASTLEIRAQSVAERLRDLKVGDICLKAGAFAGGMPLPVTAEHGGAIIFELGDGTEVLRFAPDGKVYLRGELVHDNLQAWTGLREWLVNAKVIFPGDAHVGPSN